MNHMQTAITNKQFTHDEAKETADLINWQLEGLGYETEINDMGTAGVHGMIKSKKDGAIELNGVVFDMIRRHEAQFLMCYKDKDGRLAITYYFFMKGDC